jgi:uncharacterized membrane protein
VTTSPPGPAVAPVGNAGSGDGQSSLSPTSSAAVMKLIEDQLAEERSTKSSLETRAIGVITSSGALATLLFALAALVTKPDGYALPEIARWVLALTVVAFIGAAIMAILAARPGTYQEVTVESLSEAATPEAMAAPAAEGEAAVASVLVDIIKTARDRNTSKATRLRDAVTCQTVGAVLLAVAVGIILIEG